MKYETIREGIFIKRQNRFVATVETDGRPETVHVRNTGRCRELLVPEAEYILRILTAGWEEKAQVFRRGC